MSTSSSPMTTTTTDASSLSQDSSNLIAQIDTELIELEKSFANIELRIHEDVEAEEIGIEVIVI